MRSTLSASRRPLVVALAFSSLALLGLTPAWGDPAPASRASGCAWVPGFHVAGIYNQAPEVFQSVVRATVVFDDGSGPALYAVGEFSTADAETANGIAKWNGQQWLPVASQPVASPRYFALAVYNDGGGNALYAGGNFGIRKWDGSSWSNLGAGVDGTVEALTVFGSALVVGGTFATAGGSPAANIARWNGTAWTAMGTGMDATVLALATWNDGGGDRLYAGGVFSTAGGVSAKKIARWNGSWSALGAGVDDGATGGAVGALAVFDDGGGNDLYVGGSFVNAGGSPASNIARWSGTTWSALGAGIGAGGVSALATWNDGGGNALYAGGTFTTAGGSSVGANIAKWNGTAWSALGAGLSGIGSSPGVYDLTVFDDGGGSALYAGGDFLASGALAVREMARWNGTAWSPVTRSPHGQGLDRPITAMAIHDDGSGKALYAAGDFWTAGDAASRWVAKWDGRQWSAVGNNDGGSPLATALASYDDGNGAALYLATAYVTEFPPQTGDIRKWSGGAWSELPGSFPPLRTLGVFDDGTDAVLVAAGTYFFPTDFDSDIAQFDGTTWSAMGGGIFGDIDDMATFDEGNGPALYIGGDFLVGGNPPFGNGGIQAYVAKWDGANWSTPGTGPDGWVRALAVYDDGSGPALYAGGEFANAGGGPAANLAKWDGTTWSAVGGGTNNDVSELAVFNDGHGDVLYASGDFTQAGGQPIRWLARWDGAAWSSVDGVEINEAKMIVLDQGSAESLYFAMNGIVDVQGNFAYHFAQYCQPLSFVDGFESGDASAWSQTVP